MKRIFFVYLFALTALIFTACSGGGGNGGGGSNPGNCDVTFYDNNGNILSQFSETVASGTEITLPAPTPNANHTFDGWLLNGTGAPLQPLASYTVTANTFFTAKWTATGPGVTEYTVIFHDGGNVLPAYTKTVANGTSIPLPNLPGKTDYTFNGWKENNIGAALPPSTSYLVSADVNFYAVWSSIGVTPGVVNITSAGELAAINANSANLSKHYRLMENINLSGYSSGTGWTPIGTSANPFTGLFDGNNKTISGLTINDTSNYYVGLFGYISGSARIENLTVELSADGITGASCAGGIAGYASAADSNNSIRIENSKTSGTGAITVSGNANAGVGGILGCAHDYVTITGCSNAAAINSSAAAGGIVGDATHSYNTQYYIQIYNSNNSGAVTSTGTAGGIAGTGGNAFITGSHNEGTVTAVSDADNNAYAGGIEGTGGNITDSYNTGDVRANGSYDAYAGGISAYSSGLIGVSHNMLRNYNTGAVSAVSSNRTVCAGGIAGRLDHGSILDSYNTGTVSAATSASEALYNYAYAGGIAGRRYSSSTSDSGTVSGNYNTGNISASSATTGRVYAAGILGYMAGIGGTHIITKNAAANSSVTGSAVSGTITINRILASTGDSSYTIENNFAFKDMSGNGATFADYLYLKGEDKEAADLKKKNTYYTSSGGLGWKFGSNNENPWTMPTPDGSGYPRLYWQTD